MKSTIDQYVTGLKEALTAIDPDTFQKLVERLDATRSVDRKILVMGNGGSASTASHFACDFSKNAVPGDLNRFRVVALTDSIASITAYANDVSYDQVFTEQMKNLLDPDDVVIAISASGNSPNIVAGVDYARKHGAFVIGLSGFSGGKLKELADLNINIPAETYEQIEDVHLTITHLIVTHFKALHKTDSSNT